MSTLGRIPPKRRSGTERFRSGTEPYAATLTAFWAWSVSDLVSNATRGRLAEFIVAQALGIATDGVRDECAAFDLETSDHLRVEVKSAAFVQSWHQERLSAVSFSVKARRAWDPDTNKLAKTASRQADVYVFALVVHKDKATIDPVDLDQWRFYVLPTKLLNERKRSQESIMLKSLDRLTGGPVTFAELGRAVRAAAPATATDVGGSRTR